MTNTAIAVTEEPAAAAAPGTFRRLLRQPVAIVCLAWLLLLVGVAIVAPIVMPDVSHETAGDLLNVLRGPSSHHLLGTDLIGRDVLNRLLVGTRVTLVGVAEFVIVLLVLGVPFGLAAGYFGGRIDKFVGWLADLSFAMPGTIIVIVVLTIFATSMLAGMVTLAILSAPGLMRVVRAAVLPVREELYIAAARVSGLSSPYVVFRHVLPRITGVVFVQAALGAASALAVQAGLAFLGFLVAPPAPTWGGMISEGLNVILQQPWLLWPPGIMIGLTTLAFTFLGDSLRDTTTEQWSSPVARRPRRRPAAAAAPGGAATPAPSSALLSVEGLNVAFPAPGGGLTPVIEDVWLDIAEGECVGLVGESGCGKTMTAMAVLGMLPGHGLITGGRIVFDGRDLAALPERELRKVRGREIGVIAQEPMASLDPVFRVGYQLASAIRFHHGGSKAAARQRALDLLRQVQLPDAEAVYRRYPHELSGGMAQRVAIAWALAGDPKLLLADEPTTALDVTIQAEILDLIRDLQTERRMSVLLVSHDWGVIADICDRAVVMYAGQVVERAGLLEIFRQPLHPYTQGLLDSNPQTAGESLQLPMIPGTVPNPGAWPSGCHFHPRCSYATGTCVQSDIALLRPLPDRETRCIHTDRLLRGVAPESARA